MPHKKKRRKRRQSKTKQVHSFLGIRVDHYDANVSAAINYNVYAPESAFMSDENDSLYRFETRLTIKGTGTYPKGRAGQEVEITIYGDDTPSGQLDLTLQDVQVRGELWVS